MAIQNKRNLIDGLKRELDNSVLTPSGRIAMVNYESIRNMFYELYLLSEFREIFDSKNVDEVKNIIRLVCGRDANLFICCYADAFNEAFYTANHK